MLKRFFLQKLVFSLVCVFILNACVPVAPAATPTATALPPTATPLPQPFSAVKIDSTALAGSLLDQKTEQSIFVYLPPSYNTSTKRYPVIYYLPGYGDGAINGLSLPAGLDETFSAGTVQDMIFVIAPGGSSFYANSSVSGNWEDYIVQEVVGYVDDHYRTLAQAESRGISGHSMGGYGAFNIAMHHPEVFSAVYSVSPGLFDETGLFDSHMYGDVAVKKFMNAQKDVLARPEEEQRKAVQTMPDFFTVAYGMAFAPNPNKPPFYFDYPYTEVNGELVRDDAIWKQWESGFGGISDEVLQYKDNLLALKGIVIDYGIQDEATWIPRGCIYLDEQLTAAGIPHQFLPHEGNHYNKLAESVTETMLPFFSELLVHE